MASVPTYNPNDPAERRRRGRAQPRHHRRVRAGSTMKTFTIAAALEAGVVQARRSVRLPDGADDGRQVHHPRHAPARRADRGRGVQVLEQHRRDQDRAQAGTRAGWRTRWCSFGFGRADRRRAAGRARGHRAAGRQVGRHRVRERRVRPGPDRHAAADGGRRVGDRRRRHLPAAAHRRARRAGGRHDRDACRSRRSGA